MVAQPAIKFGSSSDVSSELLGIACRPLETPLPNSGAREWFSWAKIAQLIEGTPF
jgi:hypothetical protein